MSTPTITVRFDAPAHDALRRPESRQAFADALRAHPGEWALLGKFATAGAMRQHAYEIRVVRDPKDQPFAPAGSFEAESQTLCGEFRVYVRYVGGGAA
jgi:hypothetical protein